MQIPKQWVVKNYSLLYEDRKTSWNSKQSLLHEYLILHTYVQSNVEVMYTVTRSMSKKENFENWNFLH